jgi:alkylation response protein AidB-like acyl-CoA dehydrogenase
MKRDMTQLGDSKLKGVSCCPFLDLPPKNAFHKSPWLTLPSPQSEQNAIRSMAKSFADNVLSTAAATYGKYPTQKERFQSLRPFYYKAVEGGLIKAMVPAPLGGAGGKLIESMISVEEIYRSDRSVSLSIFGTGSGLTPLSLEEHLLSMRNS